jgi:hypothetical protein
MNSFPFISLHSLASVSLDGFLKVGLVRSKEKCILDIVGFSSSREKEIGTPSCIALQSARVPISTESQAFGNIPNEN